MSLSTTRTEILFILGQYPGSTFSQITKRLNSVCYEHVKNEMYTLRKMGYLSIVLREPCLAFLTGQGRLLVRKQGGIITNDDMVKPPSRVTGHKYHPLT